MLENLQNAIRQNIGQTELPEHVYIEAIEASLCAAARRIYGADANISVEIDLKNKGNIRCYVPKKVVNILRDFSTEIPIEEARKLQADAELGQVLQVEITPSEFGRRSAQLGMQIFAQKIKQAEREKIYQEFADREGEIVTGHVIQKSENGGFTLDLGQTEAFLPRCETPDRNSYEPGKRLQCLILSVKNETRGAPVIVSRTHQDLLTMLFEQEVPEIYEGQVRIMAVARDPGNRAKVAVKAIEEDIDAVGTCVGVKGSRVQNIVSELDDEKIDLLEWSEDPSVFIANALRPASVRRVELSENNKSARVIVPDNQLSLAIGKRGQNARLAAKLTGWKVDIKSESESTVSIDELFKPAPADEEFDTLGPDAAQETQMNLEESDEKTEIQAEDASVTDSEESPEPNQSETYVKEDNFDFEPE